MKKKTYFIIILHIFNIDTKVVKRFGLSFKNTLYRTL